MIVNSGGRNLFRPLRTFVEYLKKKQQRATAESRTFKYDNSKKHGNNLLRMVFKKPCVQNTVDLDHANPHSTISNG